jgi:MarR family transcriptional regulator for hemolysin
VNKIENIIFYAIEKAIKSYRQFAQQELRKHGLDITVDQWLLLKALSENTDASQKELAEIVFKDTASITRMIDLMVKNGHLRREENVPDRRRARLLISAKGKTLLKETIKVVNAYRKKALKNISENDLKQSRQVMDTIIKNCR